MAKNKLPPVRIYPLADRGLCIDWGNMIDPALNDSVLALHARLWGARLPGVLELVPAYSSLGIIFDAAQLLKIYPGQSPFEMMCKQVEPFLNQPANDTAPAGRSLQIPVCYEPEFAPDLTELAEKNSLSAEELIQFHTAPEYRVYLIGFLPGFPYMGKVDARIATPRREQPRQLVPAGSVGIAGEQTGIYPLDSPGGWNIIGRTPLRLFDAKLADPVLLRPGDRLRFFPVSKKEFQQIQTKQ